MRDAPLAGADPGDRAAQPRRREVVGYCMYDFANSSYTTLISTVAYSVYFRQVVAGDYRGDFLWSLAQILAHLTLILISPVFGALADYSGRKKRLLLATTVQTVTACSLLALVGPGDVALGMLLLIVGMIGFEGGYVFYNAFLPEVSTPRTIGRISGWSWGTGFVGGLLALLACAPLLARPLVGDAGGALDPVAIRGYRWSFVVVAAFFAVFSIPTFVFLRERRTGHALGSPVRYFSVALTRVTETLRQLRRYRETAKFVLASLFYFGGIETVIKFSAIYASVTFGIQGQQLVTLFIFMNVVAVPGTLFFGYVADWIGGKRTLWLTILGWLLLLLWGALAQTPLMFWIMASGVAVGMGATQAIGRSFMAQISPPSRESEFFGFYLLCNKVGSILSLLCFGLISDWTGNQRIAVLSILPFFAIGLALVSWIDAERARSVVQEARG